MAKISPTMESGQIVKWLVKVGDQVKEGDTLAEVQTDKAVMPMEAFDEGTVARLDVAEGEEVPVGKRVMVLAKKGEDPKAVGGGASGAAPAQPKREQAKPAAERKDEPREVGGNGQRETVGAPSSKATAHAQAPAAAEAGGRVKSSPLARKIAEEANVDLHQVTGSGPGGRVVRRDVEAFLEHPSKPARAAEPAPAERVASAPKAAPAAAPAAPQRVALSRMRATIAQRMTEAHQKAPAIHVTVDIRMDQVAAIRERLNRELAGENLKLSMGDFVTKAVALALRRHAGVNATFEDGVIVQHSEVNVGLAVAVEGGLIVPVLRNADSLALRAIRVASEKLYESARQMKLSADQMNGATFTISNLGMYGVRQFDAILNLPQVGILAVGAAEKRPVVDGETLTVGTMMTVTLTADHRAVDGAAAAEFLRTLKRLLEEPAAMLL
jgi:pyruvate dehydrogenase E2 component (dihydrolipoamide acetyltransferase)